VLQSFTVWNKLDLQLLFPHFWFNALRILCPGHRWARGVIVCVATILKNTFGSDQGEGRLNMSFCFLYHLFRKNIFFAWTRQSSVFHISPGSRLLQTERLGIISWEKDFKTPRRYSLISWKNVESIVVNDRKVHVEWVVGVARTVLEVTDIVEVGALNENRNGRSVAHARSNNTIPVIALNACLKNRFIANNCSGQHRYGKQLRWSFARQTRDEKRVKYSKW